MDAGGIIALHSILSIIWGLVVSAALASAAVLLPILVRFGKAHFGGKSSTKGWTGYLVAWIIILAVSFVCMIMR